MYRDNPELKLAFDFVQYTGKSLFLTGKAGTGKTTFLRNLKEISPKRMIVVAPTGVAAINAGGVTIHSMFQLPFGPYLPEYQQSGSNFNANRFYKEKINIIRSIDLLVIDEISMVRADLLDGIDAVLRRFRTHSKPFGGVQLLMIGDLQQLAPVVKEDEWSILQEHYQTPYFFSSRALLETDYTSIELKRVYRQSDIRFISILNKIRDNCLDRESLAELNKRYIPYFDEKGYIMLTTHNYRSKQINQVKLDKLDKKAYTFQAKTEGDFPEYTYPTDGKLVLKENAQVMFVKNDSSEEKRYFNGKIGKIHAIKQDLIQVICPGEKDIITVTPEIWENMKYEIDEESKEIKETRTGSFSQYPLKTAWAITIHKSQGLTFEKAIIDVNASFAHGQVYVALSRCKSLEGMVLTAPLSERSIISDHSVKAFTDSVQNKTPSNAILQQSMAEYQLQLLLDLFDFTSIQRNIYRCLKIATENPGSLPSSVNETFEKALHLSGTELTNVADKFKVQIYALAPQGIETNALLQERIQKAANYFSEKLRSSVIDPIMNLSIITDNKQVKKQWKDASQRLYNELNIKKACLSETLSGFDIKRQLQAKSVAMLEEQKNPIKSSTKKDETQTQTSQTKQETLTHPELFEIIRKWRAAKATELGMPAYIILHQKTLFDLVEKLPVSFVELSKVSGFGKTKIQQYGTEILELIREYRIKIKMNVPEKNRNIEF